MKKLKLIYSLLLVNLAVFVGSATFYPRGDPSYFYENEFERVINKALAGIQWQSVLVICGLSIILTSALYLAIDALNGDKKQRLNHNRALDQHFD